MGCRYDFRVGKREKAKEREREKAKREGERERGKESETQRERGEAGRDGCLSLPIGSSAKTLIARHCCQGRGREWRGKRDLLKGESVPDTRERRDGSR